MPNAFINAAMSSVAQSNANLLPKSGSSTTDPKKQFDPAPRPAGGDANRAPATRRGWNISASAWNKPSQEIDYLSKASSAPPSKESSSTSRPGPKPTKPPSSTEAWYFLLLLFCVSVFPKFDINMFCVCTLDASNLCFANRKIGQSFLRLTRRQSLMQKYLRRAVHFQ